MKQTKVKAVLACPQITYFQVDKGSGMTQSFTCCVLHLKLDFEYQRFIYAPFSYDIQGYVLTNSYVTNVGLLISLFLFCRR